MKLAIIGLGNIAHRVAKGIHFANNATLYAVASNNKQKAEQFASQYNVAVHYDNYDALLADKEVEVVYLCTPNHLHIEQIMMCFRYGKHVICEKPLVADAMQVKTVFEAAKKHNCFLMEAEKTIFTPLNQTIQKMVQDGVIGKVVSIKADYSYCIMDEQLERNHWAFDDVYGGSSYDVGVYPICFANFFAASEIKSICGSARPIEGYVSDFSMDAIVTYKNGIQACVNSSWLFESESKGCGYIVGDQGYFSVPAFWKGNKAYLVKDENTQIIEVEMESDFTGEIEHAITCIENGLLESPVLGEKQSLEIIKVVEHCNQYRKKT